MVKDIKARILIITTAVCGVVAVVHWPAISAKALSFDDQQYLTDNPLVQNPGLGSMERFLTEVLEPSTVGGYYQPLAMISLMLDYAAGGRNNNLRPFHITSLAFHTANTALVIVLLYMLFGNMWAAAVVGLLFGVHPMTVEPIPWVGERKTLLAAFFVLWSLIFYVRYSRSGGWKSYAGCFLMYLLALMSKPTSVPLPVVMLLMDYWPLKRLSVKSIWEKLPLFALGAVFAVITYVSQHRRGGTISPTTYGPWHIPLVLCHNIIFYLYKMVWPVNLSSHYAFPKPFDLSQPMVLAGVIGTCVLIPLLLISLRWTRAALTGWLIFFVAIFPTMGVVGFTNVIASDKYAYLPAIGLLMVVTAFLIWVGRSKKIAIALAAFVVVLAGAEAFATQRYLVYWRDTISLCGYMLSLTPDAASVHNDLANALKGQGKLEEAVEHYRRAIELRPDDAYAYSNLGACYGDLGRYEEAIKVLNEAIKYDPRLANAYTNLGYVCGKAGLGEKEIEAYKTAITVKPTSFEAHYNLGCVYEKQGRLAEAIEAYRQALKLRPDSAKAHYNLGIAYFESGRPAEAIEAYKQTIEIEPSYAEAYSNLGGVYGQTGRTAEAIKVFRQLIKIDPNSYKGYGNLGVTYTQVGRWPEAIEAFKQAVKIKPDYAKGHFNLGLAYANIGDKEAATAQYDILKQLDPESAETLRESIK
jgi:tetratricopeptide (TPR) repeat protein